MTALPPFGALPGERRGYVDGPSGQIHYREMGEGPGLLLFHQAPWMAIQFHRAMPALAAAGYRVIAPDLPGHGLSDPLDVPTVEGFAAITPPLLGALGIERAAMIGHHGGALVAARAAAEYADRASALVLDNAPFYSEEQRAARRGGVDTNQGIAADGSHFTDRWALVRRIGDPEWSDVTVHLSVLAYFANGPTREHGHVAAPEYDLAADLPRIACPALVIASRTDPLFPAGKALIGARPDWSYAELSGGAGMVFDRVEEWAATVLDFLQTRA